MIHTNQILSNRSSVKSNQRSNTFAVVKLRYTMLIADSCWLDEHLGILVSSNSNLIFSVNTMNFKRYYVKGIQLVILLA